MKLLDPAIFREMEQRFQSVFSRTIRTTQVPAVAPMLKLLDTAPRPIVDSRNKIVLLWSAKAGSTFVVKWMFEHMGVLAEALRYDRSVHRYRVEVLYTNDQHKASINDFCQSPSSYRIVKVVRQPFKRAVSSYLHAVGSGQKNPHKLSFFDEEGKPTQRFSFREFLRQLETLGLTKGNIHYRLQTHPLERHFIPTSMFLLNLDYSMKSLPKLEAHLGLPRTDPQHYRDSPHHTDRRPDLWAQWSTS